MLQMQNMHITSYISGSSELQTELHSEPLILSAVPQYICINGTPAVWKFIKLSKAAIPPAECKFLQFDVNQ